MAEESVRTWEFEEGQEVWHPDQEEGYVTGSFEKHDKDGVVLVNVGGESKRFKLTTVYPLNPESQLGAPDNTRLMYLHDPHMLDNVRYRFLKNEIYTYTAHILIVVNPYRYFPELYSTEMVGKYRGRPIGTLPPHAFALADRAYRSMIADGTSQGIIVSGESGAGKTETSKHVMSYLAVVGGMEGGMGKLERRILEANPILEAFGNAKTLRNNNSSRFGKFTKIDFDPQGKIIGATIDTYLLEKSRLLFQAKGERNYHIFYQILMGLSDSEKSALKLGVPEDYHYLNQGDAVTIKGVDDKDNFDKMVAGMELIGLDSETRMSLWRLLAGLLHLGNVTFEDTEDDETAQIADLDVLERAAEMLQCDILKLRSGLLCRSISAGRSEESFEVPLSVQQATYSRDSLASVIYSRVFDFIVTHINKSLKLQEKKGGDDLFIGVLDIYGFEVFQKNSFEQLTINYANEKVHQYFIKNTFKEEQEIYKREAIKCPEIKYQDNQDALNMLEDKKRGVFAMIDDEGKKPKASDTNLLANLHTAHRNKTKRWIKPSSAKTHGKVKVTEKEAFVFRHFAGEVAYTIEGFLDKNTQQITIDAELVLRTSEHTLFPTLFPEFYEQEKKQKRRGASKTVSSQFLTQLNQLMDVLNSTTPSFIRCVKPNMEQVPGKFTGRMCLEQLRCSGMLEALSLMQIGYPTRCPYDYLYNMYVNQMPEAIRHLPASQFVEAILMALELNKDEYALGVTRVFFKAGQLAFLEQLTGRDMSEGGVDIVAKVKKWLVRKRWHKATSVVKTCVKLMKMNQGMFHFKRIRKAAKLMNLINTTILKRAREIKRRNAAFCLQAVGKMMVQRKAFTAIKTASVLVQAQTRMMTERKPHLKELTERRMRAKIEEELRKKEAKNKDRASMVPSSSGPDPYALARTKRKKKKTPEEEEAEKQKQKELEEKQKQEEEEREQKEREREEKARAEQEAASNAFKAMQEQMQKMQQTMVEQATAEPTRLARSGSGPVIMGEDMSDRLKKIEEYLERLPDIDENVITVVKHLTGKTPPVRRNVEKEGPSASAAEGEGEGKPEEGAQEEGVPAGEEAAQTEGAQEEGAPPAESEEVAVKHAAPPPQQAAAPGVAAAGAPVAAIDEKAMAALIRQEQSSVVMEIQNIQQLLMQSLAMAGSQADVLQQMQAGKDQEAERNREMVLKLQQEHKKLEDMLIQARVDIEVKAAENVALEQQIKEQKQIVVEMKSERTKIVDERDDLALQLKALQAQAETTGKQLKEKEQENEGLREKVTDLADQLVNLKRSVKELIQIRTRNLQKQQKTGGAGGANAAAGKDSMRRFGNRTPGGSVSGAPGAGASALAAGRPNSMRMSLTGGGAAHLARRLPGGVGASPGSAGATAAAALAAVQNRSRIHSTSSTPNTPQPQE